MKHKTPGLEGMLLDAAVAMAVSRVPGYSWGMAEGRVVLVDQAGPEFDPFQPSTNWAQGGLIIERERIDVTAHADSWFAKPAYRGVGGCGATPLIAAMRAYVAAKLGNEIELP